MEIKNLTPHIITFVNSEGIPVLVVEPSGIVARVEAATKETGESFCGVPVTKTEYSEVYGLPDPEPGVIYVASLKVAERVPERQDVFVPSETVRDENGRICGCKSLGKV